MFDPYQVNTAYRQINTTIVQSRFTCSRQERLSGSEPGRNSCLRETETGGQMKRGMYEGVMDRRRTVRMRRGWRVGFSRDISPVS